MHSYHCLKRRFFNFKQDEHVFLMIYFSRIGILITQMMVSLQRNKNKKRDMMFWFFFSAPAKHNKISPSVTIFRLYFLSLCVCVWGGGSNLKDVSYTFSLNQCCLLLLLCMSIVQNSI